MFDFLFWNALLFFELVPGQFFIGRVFQVAEGQNGFLRCCRWGFDNQTTDAAIRRFQDLKNVLQSEVLSIEHLNAREGICNVLKGVTICGFQNVEL